MKQKKKKRKKVSRRKVVWNSKSVTKDSSFLKRGIMTRSESHSMFSLSVETSTLPRHGIRLLLFSEDRIEG